VVWDAEVVPVIGIPTPAALLGVFLLFATHTEQHTSPIKTTTPTATPIINAQEAKVEMSIDRTKLVQVIVRLRLRLRIHPASDIFQIFSKLHEPLKYHNCKSSNAPAFMLLPTTIHYVNDCIAVQCSAK